MSKKKNPNEESSDMPNYFIVSGGKYYTPSPITPRSPHTSKRVYPTKNGVSPDTPLEFQTKNSRLSSQMANCILSKDPVLNQDPSKKPLTKDVLDSWPVKSIQTHDINPITIPIKLETKAAQPKEIYNCVNHQKKVVTRPDRIIGEETLYTKRFYEALKENKAFHRKTGYFSQFTRHHKLVNEQYKIKRSDSQEHTRYISKPVIFTSLNSKNRFSLTSENDHLTLIQTIKGRSSCSPTCRQTTSPDNSPNSPNQPTKLFEQTSPQDQIASIEPNSYNRTPSPFQVIPNVGSTNNRNGSLSDAETKGVYSSGLEMLKVTPRQLKGSRRAGSVQPLRPITHQAHAKLNINSSNINHIGQMTRDIIRFKTKEVAQAISNNREQVIKMDPEKYIQHTPNTDHIRNSNIEVSVLEKSLKYAKNHDGSPVRYLSTPHHRHQRHFSLNDNIQRFERHIDGLKKTNANFGQQRWFYDKSWRLEPLKHSYTIEEPRV